MDNGSISLYECLYNLIHKKSYREAYLQRDYSALKLNDSDLIHLTTIDDDELIKTAQKTKLYLYKGNTSSNGGLSYYFPITISVLEKDLEINIFEYIDEFMESCYFDLYTEVPFTGKGTCIQESFYLFVSSYFMNNESAKYVVDLCLFEFYNSIYSMILTNINYNFKIHSTNLIHKNNNIFWSTISLTSLLINKLKTNYNIPNEEEIIYLFCINKDNKIIKGEINEGINLIISHHNVKKILAKKDEITKNNLSENDLLTLTSLMVEKGMIYDNL